MKLIIAVGSKNPAKINAVKIAFQKMFKDKTCIVTGFDVKSGVRPQPMSAEESIRGARNRANQALLQDTHAMYGVGLEGGLELIDGIWFDCGWCVVVNRKNEEGIASSVRIHTPSLFMDYIEAGKELGEVIDIIFKTENAKQAEGHFGLMTNNAVTRTDGYVQGMCMALSRFIHPELFNAQ